MTRPTDARLREIASGAIAVRSPLELTYAEQQAVCEELLETRRKTMSGKIEVDRGGWIAALDRAAELREFVAWYAGILEECGKRKGMSPEACMDAAARLRDAAARAVPTPALNEETTDE